MNPFFDFPMLSTFIVVVAIFLIVRSLKVMNGSSKALPRECSQCGETLPAAALYCRGCGRKLDA